MRVYVPFFLYVVHGLEVERDEVREKTDFEVNQVGESILNMTNKKYQNVYRMNMLKNTKISIIQNT